MKLQYDKMTLMLKSKTKNILLVIVWVVAIMTSFLMYNYYHIPSDYKRTTFTVISSVYTPPNRSGGGGGYEIHASYQVSNKTYFIDFGASYSYGNGIPYVYYNPSNPQEAKAPTTFPTALDFFPVYLAVLLTFLLLSNITFSPSIKKLNARQPSFDAYKALMNSSRRT